jgi:membrane protein
MKTKLKEFWGLLKKTGSSFVDDNAMKLSAALSYYTIFSLPPLLIVIVSICGVFFGKDAIEGKIVGQISGLVGKDTAIQIQEMMRNAQLSDSGVLATVLGIAILIFGASGVFAEIQDSINSIWGLKAKPKKGLWKFVINRLMSFSMIATVGFLLMVGLVVNSVMDIMSQRLEAIFPDVTVHLFYLLNIVSILAIITLLFTIIYRTLPDGKIAWRDGLRGALFTAVLFLIGKFAIGAYLGNSDVASVYGAAGSTIILILWIYYSAIILYFGAEFTKVYALTYGSKITPNEYAVYIQKEEVELTQAEADKQNETHLKAV